MALHKFGFIVTGPQLDPAVHRQVMASPAFEMISIGVSTPAQGVAAARRLVDEGVQLIELCGGFGPLWTARVLEAVQQRVPVGAVGYGAESLAGMHALFAG
jgi:predicted polyphosphate/ATP-dependent NAD kinase